MESFEEALRVSQNLGAKPFFIDALEGMASLAAALEDSIRAAHLWGAAQTPRELTSIALSPGERALHEPYLASSRSRLGEEAWTEALTEGRAMSLEEASPYALTKAETDRSARQAPEQTPTGKTTGELTRREEEIAALVARDLTNRQIAKELAISERTAGNHVAKILRKLGLRSRPQIGGWAAENR
jgi:DNA-binding CsgD family transcriptional regulator